MKTRYRWIGIVLLVLATILFWYHVAMFIESIVMFIEFEGCLDSGGSYNYPTKVCDYVLSQPYIPIYRAWTFWLAIGSSLFGLWALSHSDKA